VVARVAPDAVVEGLTALAATRDLTLTWVTDTWC